MSAAQPPATAMDYDSAIGALCGLLGHYVELVFYIDDGAPLLSSEGVLERPRDLVSTLDREDARETLGGELFAFNVGSEQVMLLCPRWFVAAGWAVRRGRRRRLELQLTGGASAAVVDFGKARHA